MVNYPRLLRDVSCRQSAYLLSGLPRKEPLLPSCSFEALFVDEGKMDAQLVRDFLNAMNLRESADYQAEFSQSGAKAVISSAEKFIETAISVLGIGE